MVYRLYNLANFTLGVFYRFVPKTSIVTIKSTVAIYTKSGEHVSDVGRSYLGEVCLCFVHGD